MKRVPDGMRVLFVEHKTIFGGGQVALCRLLREIAQRRTEIEIQPVVVCQPEAAVLPELLLLGAPVRIQSLGSIQKPTSPIALIRNGLQRFSPTRALTSLIHREKIDLVVANGAFSFIASVFAAKLTRKPIVWIEHNSSLPLGYPVRTLIGWADHVIVVAEVIRRQFLSLGPSANHKMTTIHNGVNAKDYDCSVEETAQLRRTLGLGYHPVVGVVSRLAVEKGLSIFLQVAALIKQNVPSVKFLIVGEGPLRADLEAQSRSLKLDAIFTGLRKDVPQCLSLMDVFLLPSLTEGLPIALLEAMAARRAIVASDVGGVPEAIMNGITGRLVNPIESKAVAECVIDLLGNAPERHRLGENARQFVEKEFSWVKGFDNTCSVFANVVQSL